MLDDTIAAIATFYKDFSFINELHFF